MLSLFRLLCLRSSAMLTPYFFATLDKDSPRFTLCVRLELPVLATAVVRFCEVGITVGTERPLFLWAANNESAGGDFSKYEVSYSRTTSGLSKDGFYGFPTINSFNISKIIMANIKPKTIHFFINKYFLDLYRHGEYRKV